MALWETIGVVAKNSMRRLQLWRPSIISGVNVILIRLWGKVCLPLGLLGKVQTALFSRLADGE